MFLAIDSSQPRLWVALGTPGDTREIHAQSDLSHSEELCSLVERLLRERNLAPKNLEAVIIGSGPGSFTGLRIGYSFAKGLCLAAKLRLIAVPSFDAIAAEFVGSSQQVHVIADARRDEVFISSYLDGATSASPEIIRLTDLSAKSGTIVCGCASEALRLGAVRALQPKRPASSLVAIGAARSLSDRATSTDHSAGLSTAELAEIAPFYLRSVAAKTIAERT